MAEQVGTAGGLAQPSGRKLGPQMFLPLTACSRLRGIARERIGWQKAGRIYTVAFEFKLLRSPILKASVAGIWHCPSGANPP